jgi:hypothetical protein
MRPLNPGQHLHAVSSGNTSSNLESIALSLKLVQQLDQLVGDLSRPRRELVFALEPKLTLDFPTARTYLLGITSPGCIDELQLGQNTSGQADQTHEKAVLTGSTQSCAHLPAARHLSLSFLKALVEATIFSRAEDSPE